MSDNLLTKAAEKALKAAIFALNGTHDMEHHLENIASPLRNSELKDLAVQVQGVTGPSVRMRYPDACNAPKIPHEIYTLAHAQDAIRLTTTLVEQAENFITSVRSSQ